MHVETADLGVQVVIPSWNTRDLLLDCLAKLQGGSAIERIIVVDNCSDDGSADAVAAAFPQVQLLRSEHNLGFAGAVNLGLQARVGRDSPVLLLNADTQPAAELPVQLARRLAAAPSLAALSPRLVTSAGYGQPFAYGDDPTLRYILRRGWRRLRRQGALHDWNPREAVEVDWVSFACVLLSARALAEVGGLDEGYFMYFEDCDWCLRARRAGWRVCYDATLSVVHLGGASLKLNPAARAAYHKSLLRYYQLHHNRGQQLLLRLLLPWYKLLTDG